jgi:trans-aconitate 2-methyltransferase
VVKADIWNPGAYLWWTRPRTRAVHDLLGNVEHDSPRLIIDLGCGPGNNTELIADRWPDAYVLGIDSSPRMIEAARSRQRPGHLEFREGDLRDWEPGDPPDVVLASAVLQWLPGHLALLPRLAGFLAPGGVLGFQLPGAVPGSVMDIARELVAADAWRDVLGDALVSATVHAPADYLAVLGDAGLEAEAWETHYLFPLPGEGSLVEYAAGSVLRPALARLGPADADRFLAEYAERLRAVQQSRLIHGQSVEILRQRRVFAIGRRAPTGGSTSHGAATRPAGGSN